MRWIYTIVAAVAVAAPALGSPASDQAYEAGKRHVEAHEYEIGLALLDRASRADPDSSSGYRARLLQILVLNAHVGRCLSALSSYDLGRQGRSEQATAALQAQRATVAEEGYV